MPSSACARMPSPMCRMLLSFWTASSRQALSTCLMCSVRLMLCQLACATSAAGSTRMQDVVSTPAAVLQVLALLHVGAVSSGLIVLPAVQRCIPDLHMGLPVIIMPDK